MNSSPIPDSQTAISRYRTETRANHHHPFLNTEPVGGRVPHRQIDRYSTYGRKKGTHMTPNTIASAMPFEVVHIASTTAACMIATGTSVLNRPNCIMSVNNAYTHKSHTRMIKGKKRRRVSAFEVCVNLREVTSERARHDEKGENGWAETRRGGGGEGKQKEERTDEWIRTRSAMYPLPILPMTPAAFMIAIV